MFGFYTVIMSISIVSLCIMLTIIGLDEILPRSNKIGFFLNFVIVLISAIIEWTLVYIEYAGKSYILVSYLGMATILAIVPTVAIVQSWSIGDRSNKYINFITIGLLALDYILPFSSILTGWIFYYDANNIYYKGAYFYIYGTVVLLNILIMFYNIYKFSIKYNNKNNYVLVLMNVFLLLGCYIHFTKDSDVLWIVLSITMSMIYIYYSATVNQIDSLTGLLNRRCYENQIRYLKSDAKILLFDVNKFKDINDTYGHIYGDFCLERIGKVISRVYGKNGYCFRIGGDEFCVILIRKLDNVDVLNNNFVRMLEGIKSDKPVPTVSIGYSHFYADKSNIQKIIEEADNMMYMIKSGNKV